MRKTILALLSALLPLSIAHAQLPRLSQEHVDVNIGFSPPQSFSLSVIDDDNGVTYSPANTVILEVLPGAQTLRPAAAAFDFIGVGAGQNYWRLPQNQNPNLLYAGLSAYGVSSGNIDSYDPSAESGGRVAGNGPWVRLKLDSVTGAGGTAAPGFFSLWQSGDSGPNVLMSSFSGGITSDDSAWLVAGGHSHFNWGFTAPGLYEIGFRPSVRRSGAEVESPNVFKVLFEVQASVPEPGGLALLALPALGLLLLTKHRKKSNA